MHVVCCEGATEAHYINGYRARHKGAVVVEVRVVGQCGVPSSVVEAAVRERAQARRELRRDGLLAAVQLTTWAVVDRDEHPPAIVGRARDLAASNDVHLLMSNPCFELWPLLHLAEQSAWIHRHDCQRRLHEVMPRYHHDEHPYVDLDPLDGREAEAERRAQALSAHHSETGTEDDNPSTEIWRLCRAIRGD